MPVWKIQKSRIQLCINHQTDMIVAGYDNKRNNVVFENNTQIILDASDNNCTNAGYLNLFIFQGKIEYKFFNLKHHQIKSKDTML